LYRLVPGVLDALKILKPETVISWPRVGFRAYRRWKSTTFQPLKRPLKKPVPPTIESSAAQVSGRNAETLAEGASAHSPDLAVALCRP
jgi:hypothetical protein